jgi:hypothetical protein
MLSAESSTSSLPGNGHSSHINDDIHPRDGNCVTATAKPGYLSSISANDLDGKESNPSGPSADSLTKEPHTERNASSPNASSPNTATSNAIHTAPQRATNTNHTQHSRTNLNQTTDARAQIHPNNAHNFQALTSAPSSELNHADSAVKDSSPSTESTNKRDGARVVSPTSRAATSQSDASLQGTSSSLRSAPVLGGPSDSLKKRKSPEITTNSSSDGVAQEESKRPNNRDELPLDVRNKKMKATDCLLFAATLLEEDLKPFGGQTPQGNTTSGNFLLAQNQQIASSYYALEGERERETDSPTVGSADGPRDVDVLCGRGGLINKHAGNIVYRKIVDYNKPFYQSVHKKHRILVSQSIVQSIVKFGGRFMTMGKGKVWNEIGYKRAVQKTSQALRERPSTDEQEGIHEDETSD